MAEISNTFPCFQVEILQKDTSILEKHEIVNLASIWLSNHEPLSERCITEFDNDYASEHIESISIFSNVCKAVNGDAPRTCYYPYSFNSFAPEIQEVEDDQQISTQWILPTKDFEGLWESLIYSTGVKDELLNYMSTALHFSEKCVDSNIISWNRLILLHGPPGTGKTSLCKALSQKISIRFATKFKYAQLIEVNTHSLFSKWFSESGKLVTKMFHSILDLVEDPNALIIVLLDEVETLARSRSSALGGNEPSDALRVVNALLTHLDMIKRYPNVLILTTSNITEAIDVALIDRADIKKYIGLPSVECIYEIFRSCIRELQRAGIICTQHHLPAFSKTDIKMDTDGMLEQTHARTMLKLKSIAEQSVGLSGRSLRKMPFIACSLYVMAKVRLITMELFLDALSQAIDKHWEDTKNLKAKAHV